MKNQLVKLVIAASFLSGSVALAQDSNNQKGDFEAKRKEEFAKHKTIIIASLNEEKSVVDQEISCVQSAQKGDDMRKCHEAKKASMDKIRAEREKFREERKEENKDRLQQKLNKLNDNTASVTPQ